MSTKLGIVRSEAIRLIRTNDNVENFRRELDFFISKLKLRGYPVQRCRQVLKEFSWTSEWGPKLNSREDSRRIVPFKINFSSGVGNLGIGGILAKHLHILDDGESKFSEKLRILVCMRVNPNLFRLRYRRFVDPGD